VNVFRWSVTALIISAALAMAAPAHADGDSYIRYLNDHGTFGPGIHNAVRISRGAKMCTDLHNGMTPRQEIDAGLLCGLSRVHQRPGCRSASEPND
jgi:hypothetical protein